MADYWTKEEIEMEIKRLNKDPDYDPLIDAPRQVEFAKPGDYKWHNSSFKRVSQ